MRSRRPFTHFSDHLWVKTFSLPTLKMLKEKKNTCFKNPYKLLFLEGFEPSFVKF